jgi:serine/threonine protein kinase
MSFCAILSRRKSLQKTISHYRSAANDNNAENRNEVREGSQMKMTPVPPETSAMVTNQSPTIPSNRFTYQHGAKLLDRYTVQRGIGIGGFGEVYFAISDAGKEVAIKQIQRNLEIELRGVSHCLNLKHPNLVAIYDVCRDAQDRWWVVMEYVAGKNLREQIDEAPRGLSESEIRRWFSGIVAGVEHLHQEGLVHRDLKPGNLFDDRGVIKVGDYGLSKYISESRQGGHTESVGTFHYMAPEIARGDYGRQIDIYALGVILYELVTGRLPFDGESSHEIIMKHMTARPDLSGVSPPYRHAIEKALEKDPQARWRTVREMGAAIGLVPHASDHHAPIITATVVSPTAVQANATQPQSGSNGHRSLQGSEPVARAVSSGIQDFQSWWNGIRLSRGQRAVLVTLVIFGLVINTRWLLPLLSLLGIVYVPYYIIRQMLIGAAGPGVSYQEASRLAAIAQAKPKPISKKRWIQIKRIELASKRASTQLAELSGSWIAASFAALLCTVGAAVIGLRSGVSSSIDIAPYAWAGTMTMACSMAILALGKLWEAYEGDPLRRRMVMLGVGGGLGALAYLVSFFLMLDQSAGLERSISETELPVALYANRSTPLLSAYMVHFALLLAVVRWWRTTDPLRRTRLSLWSVAAIAAVDWLIHQVVPIGQPYGMLVAAGTVIATQIGAPWENPRQREVLSTQPTAEMVAAKGRLI